jgi:methylphosphotriester-DNA--protein-cysteine methyltransferase
VDDRFAFTLAQIECRPERFVTIAQAAALVNLSASRFQHLFKSKMGVPFRRYRLWRRMAVVIKLLKAGHNLTDSALSGGVEFGGSKLKLSGDVRHIT